MSANTETLENDMENRYGPRSNHYNLHPHSKPTYSNVCQNTVSHESGDQLPHYMLSQNSVKKGLKICGEALITAVLDEFNNCTQDKC